MKHRKHYHKAPNELAMILSDDAEVQMRDKSASSGVLREGFQEEVRTELRLEGGRMDTSKRSGSCTEGIPGCRSRI